MTVRPPKALAPDQESDNPLDDALQQEIMAEKAATYSRLVKQLRDALDALAQENSEDTLNAAGQALWHVIVHRDICGLRRHDLFCKELGVPDAVRFRMGRVTPR
jgi:hypothetical protein